MDEIVVLITAPSKADAEKIGVALVEVQLAACVNIMPSVTSIFSWKGEICREEEVLIIAKSRRPLFEKLIALVKAHHAYSVPEIVALPIVAGSKDYLDWIGKNTQASSESL